jgi:hypothetical protein
MTGAEPNTGWLRSRTVLDASGFVKAGPDLAEQICEPLTGRCPRRRYR